MKVITYSILLISLLSVLLISSNCGSDTTNSIVSTPTPAYIASYSTSTGTGYLSKKNGLWILNLQGSYSDMGLQYGNLAKDQIVDLYNKFDEQVGFNSPEVQQTLQNFKTLMDDRERQLLTGISSSTGLTFDQALFTDISILFIYAKYARKEGSGCSAFGATGSQTLTGHTVVGRNFDNPNDNLAPSFADKIALIIYNPVNQFQGGHKDNSIACITLLGWFIAPSVVNSKGIYLEYNNGMLSIPSMVLTIQDGLYQNLYSAFDCDSLEEIDTRYLNREVAVASLTQAADPDRMWHYERSPYENSRKLLAGQAKGQNSYDNLPDMDIFTNHFFYNDWKNQQLKYSADNDAPSLTFQRLINLQNLAKQHAGTVNVEIMKNILTTSITSGGPCFNVNMAGAEDVTLFTSVGDLYNMTFYIRPSINEIKGETVNWSEVNLKSQFR